MAKKQVPEIPTETKDYKSSKWMERDGTEHTNYECTKCQFDTLWIEKMRDHIARGFHVWAYPDPEAVAKLSASMPDEPETKLTY